MFYRYFPFGINGILSGSAAVFFSYVGFDAVTSTAEEVKVTNDLLFLYDFNGIRKMIQKVLRKDGDK